MTSDSEKGNCIGYAARDPSGVLSHYEFNRRCVFEAFLLCKVAHKFINFDQGKITRPESLFLVASLVEFQVHFLIESNVIEL